MLVWASSVQASPKVRIDPPAPELGDPFFIYVEGSAPALGSATAKIFGYEIRLFRVDGALRGVGAVPIDIDPGPQTLRIVLGGSVLRSQIEVRAREFRTSELRVDPRFTRKKLPPTVQERVDREAKEWAALWQVEPSPPLARGGFVRPTSSASTSEFGVRRVFNGKMKSQHYGLDLDGKVGDPVRAIGRGRVVLSADRYYSGGTIVLDHGNGLFSAYFHLSARAPKLGTLVEAGERIGAVGQSGRVTGPHLHLSVLVRVLELPEGTAPHPRGLYVDPDRLFGLELEPTHAGGSEAPN